MRDLETTDKQLAAMTAEIQTLRQALESARRYERDALQAAERLRVLYEVSHTIGACLNLEQLYETIHHGTARLMVCNAFAIALFDEQAQQLEDAYLVGIQGHRPGQRYPIDHGLFGYVARTRRNLYIEDLGDETMRSLKSWYFGESQTTVRSVLCVPLLLGDRVIAVISVQASEPKAYTNADIKILEQLAATAAIALENARLFAEIRRLAITDSLLGVFNRRYFFELARGELERTLRYLHPMSIVMIDVDGFKQINDSYGHLVGDQVLMTIAQRAKGALRTVDVLGRYGGEELVALLPETDVVGATEAAERLRRAIAETATEAETAALFVSASFGVASWDSASDRRLEDLLDRADRALYVAKRAGRNRICTL